MLRTKPGKMKWCDPVLTSLNHETGIGFCDEGSAADPRNNWCEGGSGNAMCSPNGIGASNCIDGNLQ